MTDYLIDWLRSENDLTLGVSMTIFAIYVITALLLIPRTFLLIATGAAFGWAVLPVVMVAANVGCILAFLATRYLGAEWFQNVVRRNRYSRAVASAVDHEGWRIVALLRFAGPLPGAVTSYLFGLSNVGLVPYTVCTVVFSAPQIIFYIYLGTLGRSALIGDVSFSGSQIVLVFALTVVCLVFWLVGRATRRALQHHAAVESI
jgi:uncharacterized membrane protein YdjX (TVP38/TMEM64 family)